jgi:transglutaminase-like putative cysteine protease
MDKRLNQIKNDLLPLLYTIALTSYTISAVLGDFIIGSIILISFFSGLNFFVFYIVKDKERKRPLYFAIYAFIYFIGTLTISMTGRYLIGRSYTYWFFMSNPDNVQFSVFYTIVAILLLSFYYSGTIFYFTVVRYRVALIFMVSLLAFIIASSKTIGSINFYSIVVLTLFFMIYFDRTRKHNVSQKARNSTFSKWYLITLIGSIILILTIAIILPKPNKIPKIAYLDQIILPIGSSIQNAVTRQGGILPQYTPGALKEKSVIGAYRPGTGEGIVVEVKGQEGLYLRFQTWDLYEDNEWKLKNKLLEIKKSITQLEKREEAYNQFIKILSRVDGKIQLDLDEKIQEFLKMKPAKIEKLNGDIKINRFRQGSYLTTSGIVGLVPSSQKQVVFSENLSFLNKNEKFVDTQYSIEYYSRKLDKTSREFAIMRTMNKEKYTDIVRKLLTFADNNKDLNVTALEKEYLSQSLSELLMAYENYTLLPKSLSQNMYLLAKEITKGKNSDYDKANAIVNYFRTNGYEYSFSPPKIEKERDYIEFFMFESKRGICTHYGTAMTLLARAAGLPARYVEGYMATEKDVRNGVFVARQKHAHAFPEVYIAGFGWMVFEPTVSIVEDESEIFTYIKWAFLDSIDILKDFIIEINDLPIWIKFVLAPFVLISLFMTAVLTYHLRVKIWKKRLLNMERGRALEVLYNRLNILLKKAGVDIKKHYTPNQIAEKIHMDLNIDLKKIALVFSNWKYGGITPSAEDIDEGIKKYHVVKKITKERVNIFKRLFVG